MRMHDIPVLFLKATIKKQVTVPGYYRKDGTFVPPHQKMVHFDPDKDVNGVVSGNGSHSQKQAHKKLHASVSGFKDLPVDEQFAHILSSATNIQEKASASAVLSGWKAQLVAGKKPTPAQQAAYGKLIASDPGKAIKLASEVKAAIGEDKFQELTSGVADPAPAEPVEPAKAKIEAHPVGKLVKITATGGDYGKVGEVTKVHENGGIGGANIPAYSVKGTDGPYGHGEVEPASDEDVAAHQKASTEAATAKAKLDELAAGTGGHYPVKAAKEFIGTPQWNTGNPVETLQQVVELAKKMQAAATASAAVSGHKKAIENGKMPSKAQIEAFVAMPEHKQVAAVQAMVKKHGLDHVMKLHNGAIEKHLEGKKPAAEPAPADDMPWPATKAAGFIKDGKPVPAELLSKLADADKAKLVAKVAKETGKSPMEVQALLNGSEAQSTPKTSQFGAENPGVLFSTGAYLVKYNGQADEWEWKTPSGDWEVVQNEQLVSWLDSGKNVQGDALKKMEPEAAPKVTNAKAEKVPLVVKKLQAMDPAEVQAWLDWTKTKQGPPPVGFFEHANKQAQTKFHKWHNSSNKFGYPDHWKATYRAAAVGSLFGMPDQVLMKDGSWKKMAHVSVNDTANVVTDVAQIHAAAVAAKGGAAVPAAPASGKTSGDGWDFTASDPAFSGAPTVVTQDEDGFTHYVAYDPEAGFEVSSVDTDGQPADPNYFGEPEAVGEHYSTVGLTPPPLDLLYKMKGEEGPKDGDTKPAADGGTLVFKDGRWHKQAKPEPKVVFTKKAKDPAAVAKIKAVSSSGLMLALNGGATPYAEFVASIPTAAGKKYFEEQVGFYKKHLASKGADAYATKRALLRAMNAAVGKPRQVLMASGGWQAAGVNKFSSFMAENAEYDFEKIKLAAVNEKLEKLGKPKQDAPAAAPAPAPAPAAPAAVDEQVFHNTSEGHNKFWSVSVDPVTNTVTKKWGKIGTVGQSQQYHYSSPDAANTAAKEWIAEKVKKGYYAHAVKPVAPKVASVSSAPVKPNDVESIDGWAQTGGQGGYNPGGTFRDANGDEWYCKFPTAGESVLKNELLATKLYSAAGVKVPEVKLVKQGGKLGIASKIVKGAVQSKEKLLAGKASGLLDGFAVDAWLANWDVVGNNPASGKGWDNIMFVGNDAHRIDAGGAMLYGGAGGKKSAFGDEVIELKTMLDPKKNDRTSAVFGKMSEADIAASVAKVLAISETTIKSLVNQFGPGSQADKDKLAATLINRQADMAFKYPKASAKSKKEKKPIVFDPSKLGEPPDFMNWSGPGKHGPATLEAKNVANHQGVRKLFEVAKQGNADLIKSVEFPTYGSDGAVTGKCSALDHPSQYVRGYAQQLINEIDFQMNPPKVFRFRGDSQIGDIAAAFPVHKEIAKATKKLGKYVLLGKSDAFPAAEMAQMPKLSWANGKVTTSTFASQSNAALAKMPSLQKSALKGYTGSGYHEQNKSLWEGNPSGAAKSAAAALHTHAYDLPVGTLLSRKISLYGAELEQLVGKDLVKTGKGGQVGVGGATGMVLQEPAIQSTSIRPSSWSGNVHFKMTVGPGVKGIYVGTGTHGNSGTGTGGFSQHPGEHELILPPNTRMLVQRVLRSNGTDSDGFGTEYTVEVLLLPNGE